MKIIYKYELNPYTTTLRVNVGSKILCVKTQNGQPFLWVLLDTEEKEMETIHIEVFPTGQHLNASNKEYIDTFLIDNDSLVFHAFKTIEA